MNENDSKVIKSFNINITDKDELIKVKNAFVELKAEGFDEVRIEIKASAESAAKNSGYDMNVYKKIKEMQSLPEWVVFDLLSSEGKLSGSDFRNRISDAKLE